MYSSSYEHLRSKPSKVVADGASSLNMRSRNSVNPLNSHQNKLYNTNAAVGGTQQSHYGNMVFDQDGQLARKMSHQLATAQDGYVEDFVYRRDNPSIQKIQETRNALNQ